MGIFSTVTKYFNEGVDEVTEQAKKAKAAVINSSPFKAIASADRKIQEAIDVDAAKTQARKQAVPGYNEKVQKQLEENKRRADMQAEQDKIAADLNTKYKENVIKPAAQLGKDILRAPVRAITSVGLQPAADIMGTKAEFQPKTPFEVAVFGEEKITGAGQRTVDAVEATRPYTEKALGKDAGLGASFALAPIGVAGMIGLDLTPFGGEKNAAKFIAKSKSAAEIAPKLKSMFKGMADDDLIKFADELVGVTNPREVEDRILKKLSSHPSVGTEQKIEAIIKGSEEAKAAGKTATAVDEAGKATNLELNLNQFDVPDEAKQVIKDTVDSVKPQIEAKVGKAMSREEVYDYTKRTSKIFEESVGREESLEWITRLENTKEDIAAVAKTGKATPEFIDNIVKLKTAGTDIGRKLNYFKDAATGEERTALENIMEEVLKVKDIDIDAVKKAAQGVDFNNAEEAAKFYRKFVKAKLSDWVDLLRYNSMLTSPITHIKNIFSNSINSAAIRPLVKAVSGGVDFLGSAITGADRTRFAGEVSPYLRGYFRNVKQGFQNFTDVMSGRAASKNLDVRYIPPAVEGSAGKVAKTLSFATNLLEGMDQFFTALAEGGELAALEYRASKGVAVKDIAETAAQSARNTLFRSDILPKGQGAVLNAIDQFTRLVFRARSNESKIVSTIAKFTIPFVKTPMNIFKQGIEYSPLGLSTLYGAADKTEQLAKAMIGTSVFAGAATMLASDRITGRAPTSQKEMELWRQSGRLPYSIKIGDRWIEYKALPPALAFPFASVAILNDLLEDKKVNDDFVDLALRSVAKYGQFLGDQTYAKAIGDLMRVNEQGESGVARFLSNYAQQLIPYRALAGWITKLADDTQRKPDQDAGFVDKQIQYLMMQLPWASEKVPARTDIDGNEIKNSDPLINAFSPLKVQKENAEFTKFLEDYEGLSRDTRAQDEVERAARETFRPQYEEILQAARTDMDKAQEMVDALTDEDYELYKILASTDKRTDTNDGKVRMYSTTKKIKALYDEGKIEEAEAIVNDMSDDDYRYFQSVANDIGLTE